MNTTLLIRDKNQKKMLQSIEDVFGDGTLYTLDFTQDYKLDEMIRRDIPTPMAMLANIAKVMKLLPLPESLLVRLGCSSFCCHDSNGHVLVGRNYDIKHEMTAMMMSSSCQADSYASISMVDLGWCKYLKGDLSDGKHDNSLCIVAPYLPVEGMNEKGLCITVLQLMAPGVKQETGKKKAVTTMVIRHVLDKAADVEEAIRIFADTDLQTTRKNFDYHFHITDRSGRSAVVEYFNNEMKVFETDRVTNFYLSDPDGELQVGKGRYQVIDSVLNYHDGILEKEDVLEVLKLISQPSKTSHSNTRWSVIYDLTDLTADIYVNHNYDRCHTVTLKGDADE